MRPRLRGGLPTQGCSSPRLTTTLAGVVGFACTRVGVPWASRFQRGVLHLGRTGAFARRVPSVRRSVVTLSVRTRPWARVALPPERDACTSRGETATRDRHGGGGGRRDGVCVEREPSPCGAGWLPKDGNIQPENRVPGAGNRPKCECCREISGQTSDRAGGEGLFVARSGFATRAHYDERNDIAPPLALTALNPSHRAGWGGESEAVPRTLSIFFPSS